MRARIFAAFLFAAVAFASALSVTPQLHAWLHDGGDSSQHECAATLLASGSVDDGAAAPVFVAPQPAPIIPRYRLLPVARVLATFEFARLEHAPPAAH